MNTSIYQNIATRTAGDIYIGVVGPVRTGKSTFIKRFMETQIIPNIDNVYRRERARDELPQSAAGKTIMTTEPKFIPKEAAEIPLDEETKVKIRLIDCVGFVIDGAFGLDENNQVRMVKTPWLKEAIPFPQAAEIGTGKVIRDHSTVGILVTTDGTIGDFPREAYKSAEEKTVLELKKTGKPFVIVLNSQKPYSQETKALAEEFHDVTGASLNDFLELDALDSLFQNGQPNLDTDNPSKYLLYQDPLLGIFDRHIEDLDLDTERYYQDLADRLEICRKHTPAYDTLFAFYHNLASTLAGKADLGVRLKKAYDAHDLSTLETICEEVIPGIINDLSTTRLLREHLWMQDAKPFGYELVDIKLSGVIARLTSTRYRLRYYIDGRVKRLEELEADRLPYFLPGTPKRENLWHRIISGADLMDTI